MPLTRRFNETVRERAARDPAFRAALFDEAINGLFAGDSDTAKAALRAYINATIGCGFGEGHGNAAEEPDAHVRTARQSHRGESFRRYQRAAKKDRRSS
jgi:hypothetical protein